MAGTDERSRPTRNDVARLAGVSPAVVSYVMTGARPVAPATAERVRAAMTTLDYRPNSSAQALRSGRTRTLGLVVPDIGNPFFAEFAVRIEAAAAERGYALLLATSHDDVATQHRVLAELVARGVDGILLASVGRHGTGASTRLQTSSDTPMVWIDAPDAVDGVDGVIGVGQDVGVGVALIIDHLVAVHGCHRLALVVGTDPDGGTDPRRETWASATRSAGIASGRVTTADWSRADGHRAALELLTGPDRPDAVVAASDLLAIGVLRAAADLGLRIPQDVAVVSFDGTVETAYSVPRLTTLRQPIEEMAVAAVEAVLSEAVPSEAGTDGRRPRRSAFLGTLVIRESCGCPS